LYDLENDPNEQKDIAEVHSISDFPQLEKVFMRFKYLRMITKKPEKYKRPMNYPVKNFIN